ncbi:hypothetical protein [Massilia oculi]|uniref:hypothetical protein n=1 Tax=Massilia oculi TaxID=945844 RepID=UPI0028AE87E4|nr:hypothetical protein [Massilia oculi]
MAQVLAAVKLVIESSADSAENVENVLARLNVASPPERVVGLANRAINSLSVAFARNKGQLRRDLWSHEVKYIDRYFNNSS